LAAIVPPARRHDVRYHGVLASAHALRGHVVADLVPDADAAGKNPAPPRPGVALARRLDWASLLQRVWGDDVTTCPRCHGSLRVLAFITQPDVDERAQWRVRTGRRRTGRGRHRQREQG
jgi:hypothetical protein